MGDTKILLQVFANTHPLLYMFVASLNNNFALMCNMYEAKIHLPNTGGAFVHNNLNWFHYYEAYLEGKDVDVVQSPQMVMFLTDTVPSKCDFFLSTMLYPQANWVKTMEVNKTALGTFLINFLQKLYDEHKYKYKSDSAMDITQLCPEILQNMQSIQAKAGDVLVFHPRCTHGTSDNKTSFPQMRVYPCFELANTMLNARKEVYLTYTTGAHPQRYAHYLTGNKYKRSVACSRLPRPHFVYPVNYIGNTILGGLDWDNIEVAYNLCALFSGDKQLQDAYIKKWVDDYFAKWHFLVEGQINLYS